MKSVQSRKLQLLGLALIVGLLSGCPSKGIAPVHDSGSVLTTQETDSTTTSTRAAQGTYIVKSGDTLYSIARVHGQSASDLVAWNQLANPDQISVGQPLRVSPPSDLASGPVVRPIAGLSAPTVESEGAMEPEVKSSPAGGVQPYSDQAWSESQNPTQTAMAGTDSTTVAPAVANTSWLWPASGRVMATFSEATNKGIDISGNPGDPVIASAAGTVVYSGSGLRGYGKLIIIKHDANYLTAYAHNQQLLAKEGENVSKGQKIAEIGSTDTDSPKLHFEVRKQGRPVDPLIYLPPR